MTNESIKIPRIQGHSVRCPSCREEYGIANDKEILYLRIGCVYISKTDNRVLVKCKKCKSIIEIIS